MSPLANIGIRVEAPVRQGGLGGGVTAVLSELAGLLERVAQGGASATIDLRSLPMSAEDRGALQAALGQGEVHASLTADGISTLWETGVSGVWWIEYRDQQGELIAELIEVSTIPDILKASTQEMTAAATVLRQQLDARRETTLRTDHATCE